LTERHSAVLLPWCLSSYIVQLSVCTGWIPANTLSLQQTQTCTIMLYITCTNHHHDKVYLCLLPATTCLRFLHEMDYDREASNAEQFAVDMAGLKVGPVGL
jgi:hypothetical protein